MEFPFRQELPKRPPTAGVPSWSTCFERVLEADSVSSLSFRRVFSLLCPSDSPVAFWFPCLPHTFTFERLSPFLNLPPLHSRDKCVIHIVFPLASGGSCRMSAFSQFFAKFSSFSEFRELNSPPRTSFFMWNREFTRFRSSSFFVVGVAP